MESTGKEPLVLTATSLPPVQVGEAEANDSEALSPELTQMFQAQNINGGRSGNNLVPAHSEDFADMQAVPDFCSGTEKKLINPWDEKAKLGDWNVMDPGPTQAPFLPSSLGPSPPSQTEEEIMRMFPSATDVIKRNPANPVSVSQRETADSSANMLFQPGDLGLLEQAGDGLSGLGKGLWGPGGGRDSASLSLNPGTRSDSKHSGHGAHGIHLPEERYPEFSAPDPMDGLPRPAAEVEVEELEEHDKTTIFVLFNGLFFPVSWYADTNGEDVKAAVLCSCDAIGDSGFKLRQLRKIPKSKRRPPKAEGDQGGESPVEVVDFIEEAAREKEKAEAGGDPDEEEEDDDDDEGLFVRLSADEIDRRFAKDKLYDFEDFDKLEHGGLYSIEKCSLREDLKKHTVDRWRRLRVLLEPFSHVETQKAISRMQRGTNLLKHTRYTSPHIRHFQLSSDCERLVWYSSKRMADTMVNAADIHGILLGQQTKNFQHYKIPALEHLSFSILYGPPDSEKTLDLTCKDEFEFDHWVTGMKAIIYKKSRKKICKAALLSHSRRFRLAIERNHVAIKLASIPEVKERTVLSLDDCLDIHALPPAELEKKVAKLQARLKTASALVNEIERKKGSETSTANTQSESEEDVDFGLRFAYESVFTERTKAEDEEMQVNRMYELVDSVTAMLQEARNKLIDIGTSGNAATGIGSDGSVRNRGERNEQRQRVSQDSKAVDSLLWRVEVDLENIEDMRQRWLKDKTVSQGPISLDMEAVGKKVGDSLAAGWQSMKDGLIQGMNWMIADELDEDEYVDTLLPEQAGGGRPRRREGGAGGGASSSSASGHRSGRPASGGSNEETGRHKKRDGDGEERDRGASGSKSSSSSRQKKAETHSDRHHSASSTGGAAASASAPHSGGTEHRDRDRERKHTHEGGASRSSKHHSHRSRGDKLHQA